MSGYNADQLERLEPTYLNNYGLQEAPFSPLHQDKFTFLDAERAQRINMLQHMCRYSNLLLIVQGDYGVGKTALMQRFITLAEPDWQVCQITANTMIDAEQLLFQAAQGFGVTQLPQDASELQELLYARVATIHHNDQTPILIIDDAHLLPKDALLAIFNLADTYVNDVNLLRIILFCEPEIERIINSKDVRVLRERVTHTMEIGPFDEEATAEYLKHRMAVAGFNGGSPFTPKLIKKIYRGSDGLPGKINQLAHEILEEGDIEDSAEFELEADPVRVSDLQQQKNSKPIVFVTLAVLIVVVVLVFQDSINRVFEDNSKDKKAQAVAESPPSETPARDGERAQITRELDLKEKIIPLSEQHNAATEQTAAETAAQLPAQDKASVAAKVEPEVEPKVEPQAEAVAPAAPTPLPVPKIVSIEPSPVRISSAQQTLKINGEGFTRNSEVMIGWTGKQKKLSSTQMRVVNDKQIEIAITVGLNEDNWMLKVIDPKAGESNRFDFKVVDTLVDEGFRKDKWLLSQEPDHFTLQLFGTNKSSNADQFIEQHKLKDKAGYFHNRHKGGDWYSVVYGIYPDQAAAKKASQTLPASLKKIKPWIRRLDDIQASINDARQQQRQQAKKASARRPAKPATKPSPSVAVSKPPTASGTGPAASTTNEAWLWSQDPRGYTLQLLGARQASSIQKFLKKYSSLNGKAVYFHTRHDSHDWYTVVYGVYADREQAKKAIARLPRELQDSSPWIRSFGSIHAELSRTE